MITIYGMPGCPMCQKAVKLAEDYDLKFVYKDVTLTVENQQEFVEKFPGVNTVPQIVWHDNHFSSYNDFHAEIMNTRNYGEGAI